jgi:hypothetical protein
MTAPRRGPPAAPVRTASALPDDDTGAATVTLLFDTQVLARIDADAKRVGISRAAGCTLRPTSAWRAGDEKRVKYLIPRACAVTDKIRSKRSSRSSSAGPSNWRRVTACGVKSCANYGAAA